MKAVAEKQKNGATTTASNTNGTTQVERSYVAPEVNIFELDDEYVIEAEMPGVAKEGLEVTLDGNTLSFVGHRRNEELPGSLLYRESRPADYRRAFDLDPAIDATKVTAEMHQGVLTLTLPKAERVKPRKIAVA